MPDFLHIKYKPNHLTKNRFRIIVDLKVSKKAVIRNKIRRRLKEILRQFEMKQGYDIVVITTPAIVKQGFKEIKEAILPKIAKILNTKY